MKHIIREWDRLKKALVNKQIALFLDYDGTLTPIVEVPQKAVTPAEIKDLLKKLLKSRRCKVAIISGRALGDLQAMVGIKGLIYAGNHGLEIEGPDIKYKSWVSPKLKSIFDGIKRELERRLPGIKGLLLEDKGLSLSLHYRLVDKRQIPLVKESFGQVVRPSLNNRIIKVIAGKKVFDIRPAVEWDKGKVVLWLLARERFRRGDKNVVPVYIGDDVTDEDAFKALKNKGLSIFVGSASAQSRAKYYLKDTAEVVEFLKKILELGSG
ncbi:MAG: trehalose-phosphatase [Candidatus Omnitrophota bacterium]